MRRLGLGYGITQQGSLLNQIPAGIYMITEEGYYMCEEDNEDILFIEEDEE